MVSLGVSSVAGASAGGWVAVAVGEGRKPAVASGVTSESWVVAVGAGVSSDGGSITGALVDMSKNISSEAAGSLALVVKR